MKFAVLPWAYGKPTCDPVSPMLSNQPAKVYPALVGEAGPLEIDSAVLVVTPVTAVPKLESKVTFKVLASHLA